MGGMTYREAREKLIRKWEKFREAGIEPDWDFIDPVSIAQNDPLGVQPPATNQHHAPSSGSFAGTGSSDVGHRSV